MRRVAGYNLDEFIHTDRWNLSKIFCGSEGTLATLLEAKIQLDPLPRHTSVVVAHFADLLEAIRAVEPMLAHGPSAVEILDHTVLELARKNLTAAPLCVFIEGDPQAVLIVEFYGESEDDARSKAERMTADIQGRGMGYSSLWAQPRKPFGIAQAASVDAGPKGRTDSDPVYRRRGCAGPGSRGVHRKGTEDMRRSRYERGHVRPRQRGTHSCAPYSESPTAGRYRPNETDRQCRLRIGKRLRRELER
jgi:hypothetical protein